jgi:general secretion pathway protein D
MNRLVLILTTAFAITAQSWAQMPPAPTSPPDKQGLRDEKGSLISAKTNKKFSDANPEDITDENFPDLIESFDYPNADIADVIKAISELTGKNFIVDPQVRGKITIIAPSQITVAEAYRAFLSALAINGLTVVPSGSFLKIKTARNAQRDSIETYSGDYFPNSDQMITRIIKLKYISADEVNKNLRILPSKDGEMVHYPPTNSIIISDYGANVERVMKIINQLDVPGFEEQLEVIRIRYAKAKDIEELISKIINKGESGANQVGVPRFRRRTGGDEASSSGAESFSLVVGDDRTNSIIVVGNKAGIAKIRQLVKQLDFRLQPDEQGGVHVYYVRHGEAEQIADTLNGIASESKKAQDQTAQTGPQAPVGRNQEVAVGPSSAAIFGGDVKVTADKNTNSLIITASKQDFDVIRNLLSKIDMAKDQVYVKVVIMEMNAETSTSY